MKKKIIFIIALLLIAFSVFNLSNNFNQEKQNNAPAAPIIKDTFFYKGEAGKDALTILKQKFSVSQDASGMVNSIVGKKANSAKHEYWAFFVNGKMASVGPADYKTANSDLIEWKIERY